MGLTPVKALIVLGILVAGPIAAQAGSIQDLANNWGNPAGENGAYYHFFFENFCAFSDGVQPSDPSWYSLTAVGGITHQIVSTGASEGSSNQPTACAGTNTKVWEAAASASPSAVQLDIDYPSVDLCGPTAGGFLNQISLVGNVNADMLAGQQWEIQIASTAVGAATMPSNSLGIIFDGEVITDQVRFYVRGNSGAAVQSTNTAFTGTPTSRVAVIFDEINCTTGSVRIQGSIGGTAFGPTTLTANSIVVGAGGLDNIRMVDIAGSGASLPEISLDVIQTYAPMPGPTIVSVFPNSGSETGGQSITINGDFFFYDQDQNADGLVVKFGGVAGTSVVVNEANLNPAHYNAPPGAGGLANTMHGNQLTVITPAHAPGIVDVQVCNSDEHYIDIPGLDKCFTLVGGYQYNAAAQCEDGIDNDSDTFTDFPSDPGCADPSDNDEFNAVEGANPCGTLSFRIKVECYDDLPTDIRPDRSWYNYAPTSTPCSNLPGDTVQSGPPSFSPPNAHKLMCGTVNTNPLASYTFDQFPNLCPNVSDSTITIRVMFYLDDRAASGALAVGVISGATEGITFGPTSTSGIWMDIPSAGGFFDFNSNNGASSANAPNQNVVPVALDTWFEYSITTDCYDDTDASAQRSWEQCVTNTVSGIQACAEITASTTSGYTFPLVRFGMGASGVPSGACICYFDNLETETTGVPRLSIAYTDLTGFDVDDTGQLITVRYSGGDQVASVDAILMDEFSTTTTPNCNQLDGVAAYTAKSDNDFFAIYADCETGGFVDAIRIRDGRTFNEALFNDGPYGAFCDDLAAHNNANGGDIDFPIGGDILLPDDITQIGQLSLAPLDCSRLDDSFINEALLGISYSDTDGLIGVYAVHEINNAFDSDANYEYNFDPSGQPVKHICTQSQWPRIPESEGQSSPDPGPADYISAASLNVASRKFRIDIDSAFGFQGGAGDEPKITLNPTFIGSNPPYPNGKAVGCNGFGIGFVTTTSGVGKLLVINHANQPVLEKQANALTRGLFMTHATNPEYLGFYALTEGNTIQIWGYDPISGIEEEFACGITNPNPLEFIGMEWSLAARALWVAHGDGLDRYTLDDCESPSGRTIGNYTSDISQRGCRDTDMDNNCDYFDTDDDNYGIPDSQDDDCDGDGIPNDTDTDDAACEDGGFCNDYPGLCGPGVDDGGDGGAGDGTGTFTGKGMVFEFLGIEQDEISCYLWGFLIVVLFALGAWKISDSGPVIGTAMVLGCFVAYYLFCFPIAIILVVATIAAAIIALKANKGV